MNISEYIPIDLLCNHPVPHILMGGGGGLELIMLDEDWVAKIQQSRAGVVDIAGRGCGFSTFILILVSGGGEYSTSILV